MASTPPVFPSQSCGFGLADRPAGWPALRTTVHRPPSSPVSQVGQGLAGGGSPGPGTARDQASPVWPSRRVSHCWGSCWALGVGSRSSPGPCALVRVPAGPGILGCLQGESQLRLSGSRRGPEQGFRDWRGFSGVLGHWHGVGRVRQGRGHPGCWVPCGNQPALRWAEGWRGGSRPPALSSEALPFSPPVRTAPLRALSGRPWLGRVGWQSWAKGEVARGCWGSPGSPGVAAATCCLSSAAASSLCRACGAPCTAGLPTGPWLAACPPRAPSRAHWALVGSMPSSAPSRAHWALVGSVPSSAPSRVHWALVGSMPLFGRPAGLTGPWLAACPPQRPAGLRLGLLTATLSPPPASFSPSPSSPRSFLPS